MKWFSFLGKSVFLPVVVGVAIGVGTYSYESKRAAAANERQLFGALRVLREDVRPMKGHGCHLIACGSPRTTTAPAGRHGLRFANRAKCPGDSLPHPAHVGKKPVEAVVG
jgi:hypothetical protein